jgi:hypothetical protein
MADRLSKVGHQCIFVQCHTREITQNLPSSRCTLWARLKQAGRVRGHPYQPVPPMMSNKTYYVYGQTGTKYFRAALLSLSSATQYTSSPRRTTRETSTTASTMPWLQKGLKQNPFQRAVK